jgi:pyruvate dehydrogenase E2 component (dihydrolipoamide acetyltransferase)
LAENINMPQMGYDMTEGTVVRWIKSEGESVSIGEIIAEIETDKAIVEFEAPVTGTLLKITAKEGTIVPVGNPIGLIGDPGEKIHSDTTTEDTDNSKSSSTTKTSPTTVIHTPVSIKSKDPASNKKQPIKISPIARQIAEENSLDISQLTGTGPGNRITKKDVLEAINNTPNITINEPSLSDTQTEDNPLEIATSPEPQQIDKMRKQIARVTTKSKQEIPHFYVSTEINMSNTLELRKQLNDVVSSENVRVSINDILIKASVMALKTFPKLNATFINETIQQQNQINIGIAIGDTNGLIMPAILDCQNKSLEEIAISSKDLITRSKNGSLRSEEYSGGTFSISNLGTFDISNFIAIIQPPQSAILAVGKIIKKPIVHNDQFKIADILTATLSADHRIADGVDGAKLLTEIKRLLESPLLLLLNE